MHSQTKNNATMTKKKQSGSDQPQIKFDAHNFRYHNDKNKKMIHDSLSELGAGRSIVMDNQNELIAGNGVYEQAQKLGMPVRIVETDGTELVVVKRTDLATDDMKRKKLAAADNAISDHVEWNAEKLRLSGLDDLTLQELNIELPEIGGGIEENEAQEDNFDEEQETIETRCKPGDLWQLGNHRLMVGDSTKPEDIAKLMGGVRADLWLTDPPYNVDYQGCTDEKLKIANDHMESGNFFNFLKSAFEAAQPALKEGAPFYIWFASREYINFETALNAAGFKVRQMLIWVKNSFVLGLQDYQWRHEPCLYGWKDGAGHNWYGDRKQTTCLEFGRPIKNDLHPTMKPVPLFAYQIKNSTKADDIVLDTFGGSGTTIIACEQIKRVAYSMELNPKYADRIIARWEKLTGQTATKI